MKYINLLIIIQLVLVFGGCNRQKNQSQVAENRDSVFQAVTLPEIPAMFISSQQRAEFLAKHYWDQSNFKDTSYISHREVVEQAWVDYLDILTHVPLDKSSSIIGDFFIRISNDAKSLNYFTELADKYLYDPNSPMRNEEMYIPVLEAMIASPVLDETGKIRPKDRLSLANKNRIGTKAFDFTYTLSNGNTSTLYRIREEYIILFINNPGCHACSEVIAGLKEAPKIREMLMKKRLAILSIYPDEEVEEWKRYKEEYSSEWINGYDKELIIRDKNLYDLKAIPTLYLLDKNKTVLLKDATLEAIHSYLLQNDKQE